MTTFWCSPPVGRDGRIVPQDFPQVARTTVHVDSRSRDHSRHPSSSTFTVRLPEGVKNVCGATLLSAELPLSYYVFSAARGTSSLTVTLDGTPRTVTVPDGNYSMASMAAALKQALDAAFAPATFTVAFDAASMRCTLTASAGVVGVDTAAAGDKPSDWDLGYFLGFRPGDSSTTSAVTGSAVASLNPENYVFIDIEELNGLSTTACADGSRKVFAKVLLCENTYTYNHYDKTVTPVDARPVITKLDKLRVALRFFDGSLVDLNGAEWSMSIEFSCTLTRAL